MSPKILAVPMLVSCSALLSGCAAMHESPDYHRHSNSRLIVPDDGGPLVFEASTPLGYSQDDPAAERQRIAWLESWLEVGKLCIDGYEIIEARPFEFLEDNPARHDMRYEVRCVALSEDGTKKEA